MYDWFLFDFVCHLKFQLHVYENKTILVFAYGGHLMKGQKFLILTYVMYYCLIQSHSLCTSQCLLVPSV